MCQVIEAAEDLVAVVQIATDPDRAVLRAATPGEQVVHAVLLLGDMMIEVMHIHLETPGNGLLIMQHETTFLPLD
jgi:hypothetical protein